ncbi:MAG: hypothetical protein GY856_13775 [bacterium]|nr:hypothetical protein [bacterium]
MKGATIVLTLLFSILSVSYANAAPNAPDVPAQVWEQIQKLTASDAAAFDHFGFSVATSGDTVVVGAYGDADAGNQSGSAYVFERNQGGVGNWGQVTKLTASDAAEYDLFGFSVAISGDTVVVGAKWDDDAFPSDPDCDSGAAYVFERNQGGADNWGEVTKLTASDADYGDYFGGSVGISGDTVVVGAYGDDYGSGSAYVFERNQGGAENWGQAKKLTASDGAADDQFGRSVDISGDTVVGGAYGDDDNCPPADPDCYSGSAYVFERNQGGADNWGQVIKLTASDADYGDQFGWSVAISGDTVVVGANGDDDAGNYSGSAYVFERNQGGADNWGQVIKLTASDADYGDFFGRFVAISGDTVVVGAYRDDYDSGSAYVFERNQGGAENRGQVIKLTAIGDNFGLSVAISGDTVVVGTDEDGDAGFESGSAYVFSSHIFSDGFESGEISAWSAWSGGS